MADLVVECSFRQRAPRQRLQISWSLWKQSRRQTGDSESGFSSTSY